MNISEFPSPRQTLLGAWFGAELVAEAARPKIRGAVEAHERRRCQAERLAWERAVRARRRRRRRSS